MSYYEGIDYWVRFVEFPNAASEAVVASHGDGTFTIYINTLFCEERQKERLQHELRHLRENHFYRDELTISQIERQADGLSNREQHSFAKQLPGGQFSVFSSNALLPGATFGFYVPDNSLQPLFKKGELLNCDDQRLRTGDIGLFLYQGSTLCRQYHKDPFGFTYLFTLNRKRQWEDIVLRPNEETDLTCLGRVITKDRYPIPGF